MITVGPNQFDILSPARCAHNPRLRRRSRLDYLSPAPSSEHKRGVGLRDRDDGRLRVGWIRLLAMDRRELEGAKVKGHLFEVRPDGWLQPQSSQPQPSLRWLTWITDWTR